METGGRRLYRIVCRRHDLLSKLKTARAYVVCAVTALVAGGLLACAAWRGHDDTRAAHPAEGVTEPVASRSPAMIPIMSRASRAPVPASERANVTVAAIAATTT